MWDDWMPTLELPLPPEQMRRLPRHPAFHYTARPGGILLGPRPRHHHALLQLAPASVARSLAEAGACAGVAVQPWAPADAPALAALFAAAFADVQPFASLDAATRRTAAQQVLEHTCCGGDGPLIADACFTAHGDQGPVGGSLVTLLPAGDPCLPDSYYWPSPPPAERLGPADGRPHLTWIFVAPAYARTGVATALLAASVQALRDRGHTELASTFLLGNEASLLWHWRNGFALLGHPGSRRRGTARSRSAAP